MLHARKALRSLFSVRRLRPAQIVVLVFLVIILAGMALLMLPCASRSGESCGPMLALFTATSATCVTGLALADTYTQWTLFGQVVLLILIQIGGLGFMTILSVLMMAARRKLGLQQRLVIAQGLGLDGIADIAVLVRHIFIGTAFFEGLGAVILSVRFALQYPLGKSIWMGIFHSVSAFCNAGFDILGFRKEGGSLLAYTGDVVVNVTVMLLIMIGGLGFVVWEDLFQKRRLRRLNFYTRLVLGMTVCLTVAGAAAFAALEWNNPETFGTLPAGQKILAAFFQSVTTRTAGFASVDQASLTQASKAVTSILMLIGGSSGSTAGGLKTVTLAVVMLSVVASLRGASRVTFRKRTIPQERVMQAVSLMCMMILLTILGGILLSVLDGVPIIDATYETVSALGTVGLSTGITGGLCTPSQILLILYMFFGRVGVMTIGFGFLLKSRAAERYHYADVNVFIG